MEKYFVVNKIQKPLSFCIIPCENRKNVRQICLTLWSSRLTSVLAVAVYWSIGGENEYVQFFLNKLTERAPEMCNSHIIIYHKKCKIVTLAIKRQKSQQTTIPSWAHLDLVRLSHYCVRTDWETVLLFREDRLRDCPFMVCGQTERLSLYGVRADWETAPLLGEDRLRDCPFIAWVQT